MHFANVLKNVLGHSYIFQFSVQHCLCPKFRRKVVSGLLNAQKCETIFYVTNWSNFYKKLKAAQFMIFLKSLFLGGKMIHLLLQEILFDSFVGFNLCNPDSVTKYSDYNLHLRWTQVPWPNGDQIASATWWWPKWLLGTKWRPK